MSRRRESERHVLRGGAQTLASPLPRRAVLEGEPRGGVERPHVQRGLRQHVQHVTRHQPPQRTHHLLVHKLLRLLQHHARQRRRVGADERPLLAVPPPLPCPGARRRQQKCEVDEPTGPNGTGVGHRPCAVRASAPSRRAPSPLALGSTSTWPRHEATTTPGVGQWEVWKPSPPDLLWGDWVQAHTRLTARWKNPIKARCDGGDEIT